MKRKLSVALLVLVTCIISLTLSALILDLLGRIPELLHGQHH